MSLSLSIYSKKAFREYLLPPINNADHTITLQKEYFDLKADVELLMDVVDRNWSILPSAYYSAGGKSGERIPVSDGAAIRIHTLNEEDLMLFVLEKSEVLAPFRKFSIADKTQISIGRNDSNDICFNNNNMVSAVHAALIRRGQDWCIENKSYNGLYVNSKYVEGKEELGFGDYVNIIGLHLVFLGEMLAVDDRFYNTRISLAEIESHEEFLACSLEMQKPEGGKHLYHRSPRAAEKINDDTIEIEEPPLPTVGQGQPLFMSLGSSLTMALPMLLGCLMMIYSSKASGTNMGFFMYSGLVMALSSAGIGAVWAVYNARAQKKREVENENRRFDTYSKYLIQKADEVREKYEENKAALEKMYPSAETCAAYGHDSALLWNRNESHADYLSYRLGLGDIDFQVKVEIPKDKFSMVNDSLKEKPGYIKESYKTLYRVPVTADLREHRMVGVIGGEGKHGSMEVARILCAQIAANNCYTDLKMVFLYDGEAYSDFGQWGFAKWLPHVWSEDKKTRYVASSKSEASDICYEIAKIFRKREEEQGGIVKDKLPHPFFIFFISNLSLIENELISKYILEPKEEYGISVVVLSDFYENLPNNCSYIIENTDDFKGMYDVRVGNDSRQEVEFDKIDPAFLEAFARRLNNIEVQETELGGEIPSVLTFFDMYGINRLEELNAAERWLKNRTYDHISGMLGQKAGEAPCVLDVHEKYHGPHGLVAGTTGSGYYW